MLTDHGIVYSVDDHSVVIQAQVKSTCAGCDARSTCGAGLVARAFTAKTQMLTVKGCYQLAPGDEVKFGVDDRAILIASFWVYVMPILGLLIGAAGFSWISSMTLEHELVTILGSTLTAYLGFKFAQHRLSSQQRNIQIKLVDE